MSTTKHQQPQQMKVAEIAKVGDHCAALVVSNHILAYDVMLSSAQPILPAALHAHAEQHHYSAGGRGSKAWGGEWHTALRWSCHLQKRHDAIVS
jgi:hypothetical protein